MPLLIYRHLHGEERFNLFKNLTVLGSASGGDVHLEQDGVAEEHAHILRNADGSFTIASLGRGKQVLVNGVKEKKATLQEGDSIQIGRANLMFFEREPRAISQPAAEFDELSAFRQVVTFSDRILRASHPDQLLEELMDELIKTLSASRGFLILFEAGQPEVKVARGLEKDELSPEISKCSDAILQKVLKTGEPIIVEDALHDANFSSSVSVMNLRIASVLCIPLREQGELTGLIYLGQDNLTHAFTPKKLEIATTFAAQAALLIMLKRQLGDLEADRTRLAQIVEARRFGAMIGACESMEKVYHRIRKVAPTDISVLITGETGTGKELIAQEIHKSSPRASEPFVAINCGAIPGELLESELFGHVKGAFTGASQDRAGRFQQAHGGTLFLDEIGEMPIHLQVKILRAIQEKQVMPVGGIKTQNVDIRVLAATHRNLESAIEAGEFREDLYYRLNVVEIELPPLRDRGEDLMLLARFMLKRARDEYGSNVKDFAPRAVSLMKNYSWPGNVRELENRVKKAAVLCDGQVISPEDLGLSEANLKPLLPLAAAKDAFQRDYVNQVLERFAGNRTKAAEALGVDPRTIFRHLEKEAERGES